MSNCKECVFFYEEEDTQYQDCEFNAPEKYWFAEIRCPHFRDVNDEQEKRGDKYVRGKRSYRSYRKEKERKDFWRPNC